MGERFPERLLRCLVGLGLFGFGIALFLESHLGVPPWDVFHKGVADKLDVSIGVVIIATGVVLLFLWIPLRQRPGLGTILNALEIGLVVDLAKGSIGEPDRLWVRQADRRTGRLPRREPLGPVQTRALPLLMRVG